MKLLLTREYWPSGTNGALSHDGVHLVHTIELPWRKNQRNISCIPEGIYELERRHSERYGWHLLVKDVPNRSGILFHAANNALKELKGCIAPVAEHTDEGRGIYSRLATVKLRDYVFEALESGESVILEICSESDMALNLCFKDKSWTEEFI